MLAAVAHLAKSGQPLHHLTIATDPVQSCTLGIKLAKRTGKTKLIHLSVICSLQSSLCLGVPAASGLTSGLPTPVLRTQGQAHTHTDQHTNTSLPPRMDERQQAGQTRHRLGSVEGYTWSCQKLNLGSAPAQFFPPQQFKIEEWYAISCGQFVTVDSQCLDTI